MPVGLDTSGYRRRLPHLSKRGKTYYVTFCTRHRLVLSPQARDEAFASCIYDHGKRCWVTCAVVMPDHVHLILTPFEEESVTKIVGSIKGASGFRINHLLGRRGSFWQEESFDRIVRRGDNLFKKAEYIAANPVRAGLARSPEEYRWLWRATG